MTQKTNVTTLSNEALTSTKIICNKQINIEEITQTFKTIAKDIAQIAKLVSEENTLVAQSLSALETNMKALSPISLPQASIPIEHGIPKQINIQHNGKLQLIYANGSQSLVNLSDPKNRDLMIKVMDEIRPKLKNLTIKTNAKIFQNTSMPASIQVPVFQPETLPINNSKAHLLKAEQIPSSSIPDSINASTKVISNTYSKTPDPLTKQQNHSDSTYPKTPNQSKISGESVSNLTISTKNLQNIMKNKPSPTSPLKEKTIGQQEYFDAAENPIFYSVKKEQSEQETNEPKRRILTKTTIKPEPILKKIDTDKSYRAKILPKKRTKAIEILIDNMMKIEKDLALKIAKNQQMSRFALKLNSAKKDIQILLKNPQPTAKRQALIRQNQTLKLKKLIKSETD